MEKLLILLEEGYLKIINKYPYINNCKFCESIRNNFFNKKGINLLILPDKELIELLLLHFA